MRFELKAGLVLRHGQRTLELTRMLSTTEAQFEDTLTRRARVMKVAQVWVESSANTYDVFLGVAVIYLVLTSAVSLAGKLFEHKLVFAQ